MQFDKMGNAETTLTPKGQPLTQDIAFYNNQNSDIL